MEYKGIHTNLRGVVRFPVAGSGQLVNMVRTVLDSFDPRKPGTDLQKMVSVEELFAYYEPYVKGYNAEGCTVLFVVNRQTWGDGLGTPWSKSPTMSWQEYADRSAEHLFKIVSLFRGYNIGIQIENEPDVDLPPDQTSSVYISPSNMAKILKSALQALDAAKFNGLRLGPGLATGTGAQLDYWQKLCLAYGSIPPVQGVASHLYTLYPDRVPPIRTMWTGKMSDAYAVLERSIGKPIYLTELGVAADFPFAPEQENAIATYTRRTYEEADRLGAKAWVMWGYSDWERYGGIVRRDGSIKRAIYDAFAALPIPRRVNPPKPTKPEHGLQIKPGVTAVVRSGRSRMCPALAGKATTEDVIIPLDCETSWMCKVGNEKEWLMIRWSANQEGYVRGDLLEWV